MTRPLRRILIAHEYVIVRRGVRDLLRERANLEVVGEAESPEDALLAARQALPDIAIIGDSFRSGNGADLTLALKAAVPPIRVLVFTREAREEVLIEAIDAGAHGIVLNSDPPERLLEAIDALSLQRTYFSGAGSQAVVARHRQGKGIGPGAILTRREREVVRLIAAGASNKVVARQLSISVKTVETHRAAAMQKLELRTGADLVRYAIRSRIIEA